MEHENEKHIQIQMPKVETPILIKGRLSQGQLTW